MIRLSIRLLPLAFLVLGLFDCLEATQITVVVTTTAACGDVGTTTLTVGQLGELEQNVPVSSRDGCEEPPSLIGSVVVVPRGSNDAPVAFRVVTGVRMAAEDCKAPDYKGCIVARRALSYAPHKPLRVNVRMDLSCLDVPCGVLETCSNGQCIPAQIPDPSKCGDPQGCDEPTPDAGMDAMTMPDAPIDAGADGMDATKPVEAPLACFTVSDGAGLVGSPFAVDASCSSDPFDSPSSLEVRWDFESDGNWDTPFSTTKTASTTFSAPGLTNVTLEVRNTGSLTATTWHAVSIFAQGSDVIVTTSADESDANATPQSPGGTGLSLREAMTYVDGLGQAKVIRFKGPMTITVGSKLPALTAPGASIVGMPGVVVDMNSQGSTNTYCFDLAGANTKLAWVAATNCPGYTVSLDAPNTQALECKLTGGTAKGHGVNFLSIDETLGPHNEISGFTGVMNLNAYAVFLATNPKPGKHIVDGNIIHDSYVGILTGGWAGQIIQRNVVYANLNHGIQLFSLDNGDLVRFNVVDGNGADGIHIPNNVTASDIRDNIISNNAGWGIGGTGTAFVDPNGYFNNAAGNIFGLTPAMTSTTIDPLYVNRSMADFRLLRASPCINKGVDLGLDVNGTLPGNYNGSAPDFGATESPF